MKKIKSIASKYCSNWNAGSCIGCMFIREDDKLYTFISSELNGKPCIIEDGCEYFEEIVIPGIANDKDRQDAMLLRKT